MAVVTETQGIGITYLDFFVLAILENFIRQF